jgi:7 transmembrane sweet-taste receptor of 3 GCPR
MSIPWLAFTGFTCTFAALFSKTWRVNKFFHTKSQFGRIKISEFDVLLPFTVLLSLNFIVLICWTVIDPLTYEREFLLGTDYWNREIASVGRCRSDRPAAYLVPLACGKSVFLQRNDRVAMGVVFSFLLCSTVNFFSLVIAGWQAWQARDIQDEFSEGKYIGLSIFSMCQGFMTGIPVIAIVKDIPEAFYLVTVFLIFMLCFVVLSLVFLPKIFIQYKYSRLPRSEQRQMLAVSVRKSAFSSRDSSKAFDTSDLSSQPISGLEMPKGGSGQFYVNHSGGSGSHGARLAADRALRTADGNRRQSGRMVMPPLSDDRSSAVYSDQSRSLEFSTNLKELNCGGSGTSPTCILEEDPNDMCEVGAEDKTETKGNEGSSTNGQGGDKTEEQADDK